jgi:hypothetical protein
MSLPSKLTSYFAIGKPVIAAVSSKGATVEEVRRAQAGIVVRPNNPEELLRGVVSLAQDPEANSKYGANACLYAKNNLQKPTSMRLIEKFVVGLADSNVPTAPTGTSVRT